MATPWEAWAVSQWMPLHPWLHAYWTGPHIAAYHQLAETAWKNEEGLREEIKELRKAATQVEVALRIAAVELRDAEKALAEGL